MIWFKDRFFAIGTINAACCADGDPANNVGVIWTSTDGRSWRLADITFKQTSLTQVATDGERLLVLGRYAKPGGGPTTMGKPAAWASLDGRSWQRAPGPAPLYVVRAAGRFIGAVSGFSNGIDPWVRFVASQDGLEWSVMSETYEMVRIRALASRPGGDVLAIGEVRGADGPHGTWTTDVVVIQSPDGLTWGDRGVILRNASAMALSAGRMAYYAVIWPGGSEDSTVWRLQDGDDPVRLALEVADTETLWNAFVADDALIVTGTAATEPDGVVDSMIWITIDGGRTWGRVADQPAFEGLNDEIASMISTPNGLIAVGSRWDRTTGHPLPELWLATR